MRIFCRSTTLAGLALLMAGGMHAFPIPPVNLWKLTAEADLIVLAEVDRVENDVMPIFPADGDLASSVAFLKVRETLKGPFVDNLEVAFSSDVVCPAPPRYMQGGTVLAFLRSSPEGLRTVGLSYGALYPKPSELDDFRIAVIYALTLQNSLLPQHEAARDWAAEVARRPATRWHGLQELEAQTRLPPLLRPNQKFQPRPLELHRLQTIAEWFAQEPPTDHALPMALRLLADFPSRAVDLAAVAAVEAVIAKDPQSFWLRSAVPLTLRRFGGANFAFDRSNAARVRESWSRARQELGIPEVAPAKSRQSSLP